MKILATPAELDARDGWWKWDRSKDGPRVNENSADKWLCPVGLYDEVKRALRRTQCTQGYWLRKVKPEALSAVSKRLAKASLEVWDFEDDQADRESCVETFVGPRAAEQYIAYRREQLGLSNSLEDEPELQEMVACAA